VTSNLQGAKVRTTEVQKLNQRDGNLACPRGKKEKLKVSPLSEIKKKTSKGLMNQDRIPRCKNDSFFGGKKKNTGASCFLPFTQKLKVRIGRRYEQEMGWDGGFRG